MALSTVTANDVPSKEHMQNKRSNEISRELAKYGSVFNACTH
jgi:hypothetical protein